MNREMAGSAMYVFLRAIMEQVGIERDTQINIKLDETTVKSITLGEALDAWDQKEAANDH